MYAILGPGEGPPDERCPAPEARLLNREDALSGRMRLQGRVCVVGSDCRAIQTAEYLAVLGCLVTVISERTEPASDALLAERQALLRRVDVLGVSLITGCELLSVQDLGDAVILRFRHEAVLRHLNVDRAVIDGAPRRIPA